MHNWKQAAVAGAFIGAISAISHGLQNYGVKNAIDRAEKLAKEYGIQQAAVIYKDQLKTMAKNVLDK